jgi:tRNA threonylcarbamoyladenosine modification (KEOPS) complex  Pcc1 subunit
VTPRRPAWSAVVRVRAHDATFAGWLERALSPEAAREVPRARTTVRRAGATLELRVEATDAGAMRAALNTYLGRVALLVATAGAARPAARAPAAGEALISRPR